MHVKDVTQSPEGLVSRLLIYSAHISRDEIVFTDKINGVLENKTEYSANRVEPSSLPLTGT